MYIETTRKRTNRKFSVINYYLLFILSLIPIYICVYDVQKWNVDNLFLIYSNETRVIADAGTVLRRLAVNPE